MNNRTDIIKKLLFENTNLPHPGDCVDDFEQYYDSFLEPKKISTAEFVALVKQELQTNSLKLLREERNKRLVESDWIVSISDSPFPQEKIDEWKVYRQALRDLPTTAEDPTNPVWPTIPTA